MQQIFLYSLHDQTVSQFRRMMTLEQFRSPELAALYSKRYVDRMIAYHAGIFRALISARRIAGRGPGDDGVDVRFPCHHAAGRLRPPAGT